MNFGLQFSTFSGHKFRNLVKFLVMCYPNGRIAQSFGPYVAEDDDFITRDVIEKPSFKEALKEIKCIVEVFEKFLILKTKMRQKVLDLKHPTVLEYILQFLTGISC